MSMLKRFNVTFRKKLSDTGDKKYLNIQIGKGYETEKGHIDVIINSVPLNWDGNMRLWLNVQADDDEIDEVE
ncbi:MAG TPA: hypothetical protein VIH27_00810 [Nitrososphaerales archaeon]